MLTRILLVDDNRQHLNIYLKAINRAATSQVFSDEPAFALSVEDADTVLGALEKMRSMPFEILIVDLKIPGSGGQEMGGLELIQESRKLDPLRLIIAITGYGTIELTKTTLSQGIFDFIDKLSSSATNELVDAIKRAIGARRDKIRRSRNPFTPMVGFEPAIFGGRATELEFFETKLNRAIHAGLCEHFLVLGSWGIGKSTLLREYKKIAQNRRCITCIVPLEPLRRGMGLSDAARSIVEGIFRDLPYTVERFKKISEYFASAGISVLGTGLQFSRNTDKSNLLPQAFLHDTLTRLWEDLADKTEVLMILLDDLDNFAAVSEIVMTLRQTLSMEAVRKKKILFGMSATHASWLNITSRDMPHHPLARYFISRIELGLLTEPEVTETIEKSLHETPVVFDKNIMHLVYKYTKGHPFEMQVLCSHLFNYQLAGRVNADVWDKALQSALADMGNMIFARWYEQASAEELKILQILAGAESNLSVRQIKDATTAVGPATTAVNLSRHLQKLNEKNLITKTNGGLYSLPDPLFRAYIGFRARKPESTAATAF